MSERKEVFGVMYWFDSGPGAPGMNMALDHALVECAPRLNRPVLRFYAWTQPSASFGYFQKYGDVERATPLRPLVRRPTAGGVVPHDADWTYSLVFPAGTEWHGLRACASYRRVHVWIQSAFARLGIATELASESRRLPGGLSRCFEGYEQFDVLWGGRKLAGAAQRRTRDGLLIQGSVQYSLQPLSALSESANLGGRWREAMVAAAAEQGLHAQSWSLEPAVADRAAELSASRYSLDSYTRKR